MIVLPRSVREILEDGDELAKRFEDCAIPALRTSGTPRPTSHCVRAALIRAEAERSGQQAVTRARTSGYSWRSIGAVIGTSGEAARQRYGAKDA